MIYFIIYLFLEVMVSSAIAGSIGGLLTFIEIILSAIIGIFILQNFKFSLIEKINSVRTGSITQEEFLKGSIGSAIGAVFLIVPGFFTDILGILFQFTFFTLFFSRFFKFKQRGTSNTSYSQSSYSYTQYGNINKNKGDDDVIDVEVIDDNNSIKH